MEQVSEQCWSRIESLRHRVKSICLDADRAESASIDAEFVEVREYVFAALRDHEKAAASGAGSA